MRPRGMSFPPEWMADWGIEGIQSLPGTPLLFVRHRVGGAAFEFLAVVPCPAGLSPETILASAMRHVERGITQRRGSLVGTFLPG